MTETLSQTENLNIFDQYDDSLEGDSADRGLGALGWWPPKGAYACYWNGYQLLEKVPVKYFDSDGNLQTEEVPGIQFFWGLADDPTADNPDDSPEPRDVKGMPIGAVSDDIVARDQSKDQFMTRSHRSRFLGHCECLLGYQPQSFKQGVAAIQQMWQKAQEMNAAVEVMVYFKWRKNRKTGDEFRDGEYCQELISGLE